MFHSVTAVAGNWIGSARSLVEYHYTRRCHVLVGTADRQHAFALIGGFRARHRFAALYLSPAAQPRTRIVVHQPATADDCRRLAQEHGLVVFCGDTAPEGLAGDLLTIPFSVDLEVATPSTFTGPDARWSRSVKANINKVRRERFVSDVVNSRERVNEFRERMLLPSMDTRYGVRASVDNVRALTAFASADGSELVRVLRDGTWVGASLNHSTASGYLMRKLGWLNGDEALHKSGVVPALYWFSFQRAAALGHRRIILGGVEPCLEDGLFRHKSFWGARLAQDSRHFAWFGLLLEPSHPSCRRFLQTHSLITRGDDRQFIVFSGQDPDVAEVTARVRSSIARWYVWRDQPLAVPEVRSNEVPAPLRRWVRLAESAVPL